MTTVICMDARFNGETRRVCVSEDQGVYALLSVTDSRPVAYHFIGHTWTESRARLWLRNNQLNQVYFRNHDNGKIFFNSVKMSSHISQTIEGERVSDILPPDVVSELMVIETKHGSDKPFIIDVVAMDFQGKDTVIGNGLEFSREIETGNIKDYVHLKVHQGHLGFFEDHRTIIGNTVAAKVGDDGNPHAFMYIYPHGEGGELRTNLALAAAQGPEVLSDMYPVSMYGKPVDFELVEEEEGSIPDVNLGEKPFARIKKWKREALDFVTHEAIEGSGVTAILNSEQRKLNSGPITLVGDKKVEITMSEVMEALKQREHIALSDLLAVPSIKSAFEEYVKLTVDTEGKKLLADEKVIASVIESCPEDAIKNSNRVKGFVDAAIEDHKSKVESMRDSIPEIAKSNEIELSQAQTLWVQNGVEGTESEQDLVTKIKSAIELSDLSDRHFNLDTSKSKDSVDETAPIEVKIDEDVYAL